MKYVFKDSCDNKACFDTMFDTIMHAVEVAADHTYAKNVSVSILIASDSPTGVGIEYFSRITTEREE